MSKQIKDLLNPLDGLVLSQTCKRLHARISESGRRVISGNKVPLWQNAMGEPVVAAVNSAYHKETKAIKKRVDGLLARRFENLAAPAPSGTVPLRRMLETIWGDRCHVSVMGCASIKHELMPASTHSTAGSEPLDPTRCTKQAVLKAAFTATPACRTATSGCQRGSADAAGT